MTEVAGDCRRPSFASAWTSSQLLALMRAAPLRAPCRACGDRDDARWGDDVVLRLSWDETAWSRLDALPRSTRGVVGARAEACARALAKRVVCAAVLDEVGVVDPSSGMTSVA